MSTGSTKRARKKARADERRQSEKGAPPSQSSREVTPAWAEAPAMSERTWTYLAVAVVVAAALLRLVVLELKPMHHDEGVNGFFLTNLLRNGVYRYDPANYHGPSLYYLTLPSVALLGLNTFAVRLVTALFGVATVALVLYLRRYIGAVGALAAAALVAFSPGAVYYSRYFIHETLFVFFTVAAVVAALRYWETGEAGNLMLAAAALALMFATKETAFISAGVLLLATGVAWGWTYATGGGASVASSREKSPRGALDEVKERLLRFGGAGRVGVLLAAALFVFLAVNVFLYSSFFTNAKGVTDALETFKIWTKTGTSDFHKKGFAAYLWWLKDEEAPTLLLAVAGAAVALFARRRNRFAVFAGAWAFGTALAYSLIPYKTPWLMLSFTVPMAIAGGYAIQFLYGTPRRDAATRALAVAGLGFALAAALYQTYVLNFKEYDNDKYPYVYAHTRREFVELMREVERLSARTGSRATAGIAVATPDYWPMPWYLNDHTSGVAYDQKVQPRYDPQTTPIVIGREMQLEQLRAALGPGYKQVGGQYSLRPGVNLVLFARADLAAP